MTDMLVCPIGLLEGMRFTGHSQSVKSGETQTIPIPKRDADVGKLLEAWREDRAEVEAADIQALEAEIDGIVYDLFGLDEAEREVVEGYLEVF